MSVEKITTHVIQCDYPDCDERFGDVVETSAECSRHLAVYHGWSESEGGERHLCPEHVLADRQRRLAGRDAAA